MFKYYCHLHLWMLNSYFEFHDTSAQNYRLLYKIYSFYNFSVVLDILKTIYVSSPCKEYDVSCNCIISCKKQWWTNTIPSTYLYYKYHLQLHYFSSTFIIMSKFILFVCFFFFSCSTVQYYYFILSKQWLFTLCRKTTCTKPEFCTKRTPKPPSLNKNDVSLHLNLY
jgi:hypothetical protein